MSFCLMLLMNNFISSVLRTIALIVFFVEECASPIGRPCRSRVYFYSQQKSLVCSRTPLSRHRSPKCPDNFGPRYLYTQMERRERKRVRDRERQKKKREELTSQPGSSTEVFLLAQSHRSNDETYVDDPFGSGGLLRWKRNIRKLS